MKEYRKVEVEVHVFLISGLDGVSGQLYALTDLLRGKTPVTSV
jgi:hypothetical protein